MSEPSEGLVRWLPEARAGSATALGQMLDACRGYLLMVAQQELDPALMPKGGASDLVQETMLDATRGFEGFDGASEPELKKWLRRLLLNNLVSFARRFRDADKRAIAREVHFGPDHGRLTAASPTPSREAMAREENEAIRAAMDELPEDYRQVILLRYQEEKSFEDIGHVMNLTPNAARKLWLRAVKRLQQEVKELP
jgi:RNA polymerase sigma-70 factor (ECF subfamily)